MLFVGWPWTKYLRACLLGTRVVITEKQAYEISRPWRRTNDILPRPTNSIASRDNSFVVAKRLTR